MAEMVVGEKVTLEEMGGARMHATISGCGDQLATDDAEAIDQAKQYFSYLPQNWTTPVPSYDSVEPARRFSMILCQRKSQQDTTSER
jgi:acetyl-CoA carboxylase carboxyltransferase component